MDEKREYWAFVSYRHLDNHEAGREWATWIAREIETYEVPPELAGTTNGRGDEIPERIYPVFRDEDELSADDDLASPIYEALRNSKTIVVVCSPNAVESRYVGNEIAYFKSLGRADRVLAMMITGEPHDKGGRECFPEALKHPVDENGELVRSVDTEPVAADFRLFNGEQGWTTLAECRKHLPDKQSVEKYRERCDLAKLKIIAGILDVPLGVLAERDKAYQLAQAKRRARIFTAVAAAMGVLAILAIVAGVFAWINEQEAARERDRAQRSEKVALQARGTAEGLIGDILFDLGNKLALLNKVELLDDVSLSAKDYFDNLPPDQIDEETERNRGVMLASRARVLEATGDLGDALRHYEEALEIDRNLLATEPNDAGRRQDLVISLKDFGDALLAQNRPAEAEEKFREAGETMRLLSEEIFGPGGASELLAALLGKRGTEAEAEARKQLDDSPGIADIMFTSAVVAERLGDAHFNRGEFADASEYYQSTVEIQTALARYRPDDRDTELALAASYDNVANLALGQNDLETAAARFQEIVDLSRKHLDRNPRDVEWREYFAHGLNRLGVVAHQQGNAGAFRDYAEEALAFSRSIAREDPRNLESQRGLFVGLTQKALAERASGNANGAWPLFDEAGEIAGRLVEADRTNATWRNDYASNLLYRAAALRSKGDYRAARELDLRIIEQNEALLKEAPQNLVFRRNLLLAINWAAVDSWTLGEVDDAVRHFTRSAEVAETIVAELPVPTLQSLEDLANVYSRLGQLEVAREDDDAAREWLQKSIETHGGIFADFSSPSPACLVGLRDTYSSLGQIESRAKHWDEAAEDFGKAVEYGEKIEQPTVFDTQTLVQLYSTMSQVHQQKNQLREAVDWGEKGLSAAREAFEIGVVWEGLTEDVLREARKNLDALAKEAGTR